MFEGLKEPGLKAGRCRVGGLLRENAKRVGRSGKGKVTADGNFGGIGRVTKVFDGHSHFLVVDAVVMNHKNVRSSRCCIRPFNRCGVVYGSETFFSALRACANSSPILATCASAPSAQPFLQACSRPSQAPTSSVAPKSRPLDFML